MATNKKTPAFGNPDMRLFAVFFSEVIDARGDDDSHIFACKCPCGRRYQVEQNRVRDQYCTWCTPLHTHGLYSYKLR